MSVVAGKSHALQFFINAADLAAPVNQQLVAHADGYIESAQGIVQVQTAGAANLTVNINGVAVVGLVLPFPDASPVGTVVFDPSTQGSATRKVKKGDRIEVIPGAPFTAGAINGQLLIRESIDLSPLAQY